MPLALVAGQQFGVPQDHPADLAERRPQPQFLAAEGRSEVAEQPGPPEAAPADHDARAAGLVHHLQGVLCLPDVAVAEHRDVDLVDQFFDACPVGLSGVGLLDGAAVQRDRGGALLLSDAPSVEEGLVVLVDADARLDGDGHAVFVGGADRLTHDRAEPVPLVRQHPAAALAGHLGDGAAEVEVDVVDGEVADQDPGRVGHHVRVDPVQLHRAGLLPRVEREHVVGLVVADHEAAGGDHLAHVQPGALLTAQLPVGGVGDAGHRREHDGQVDDDGVGSARRVQAQRGNGRHVSPGVGATPGVYVRTGCPRKPATYARARSGRPSRAAVAAHGGRRHSAADRGEPRRRPPRTDAPRQAPAAGRSP